jgi:pimeloyl-ACP methyl ester carboxylesterase
MVMGRLALCNNYAPTDGTDPSGEITVFFHGYNQGSSGSGSSSGSSGSSSAGSSVGGSSGSSGSRVGGSSGSSNSSLTGNEQNTPGRYPQFRKAGEKHFEYYQVDAAVELVKKVVGSPNNQKEPIVLIGHSWGGAGALEAAKQLTAAGYKVDLLATIDPVTRGGFLGLDALLGNCQDLERPDNVKLLWNWFQDTNWPVGDSFPKADKNIKNLTDKNGAIFGHRDIDEAPQIVDAILKKAKELHDNFRPNKR